MADGLRIGRVVLECGDPEAGSIDATAHRAAAFARARGGGTWEKAAERHQRRLLHRLGERRMRGDRVADRFDCGLGRDADDAGVDQLGRLRPDDHEPQQLAVTALVDRLGETRLLAVHLGPRARREKHGSEQEKGKKGLFLLRVHARRDEPPQLRRKHGKAQHQRGEQRDLHLDEEGLEDVSVDELALARLEQRLHSTAKMSLAK